MNALTQEVIASMAQVKPNSALPRFNVSELPAVYADINLLRPALTNLIGNAVKFCGYRPQGSVDVLGRVDALTGETIIQVRDNGIGFCGETATDLFQPFTRLHGNDYAGHGVGLSIVRRAIERQGGRVWAESTSGSGASFFFALPANPNQDANADPTTDQNASSKLASGAELSVLSTMHVQSNEELPPRVALRA
jgi:signal transduction histidine kinase